MLRRAVTTAAIVACLANVARAEDDSGQKTPGKPNTVQGLWRGFWGGGEAGGVIRLPAMAELFIEGDIVRMRGFPHVGRVDGTIRIDERTSKITVTPKAKAADQPAAQDLEYTYDLKDDKLTLTGAGQATLSMERRPISRDALPRINVDLVTVTGIDDAGELLLAESTELESAKPAAAAYFSPHESKLTTKDATAFLVQQEGLKKISLTEARALLRRPRLVAIASRQDLPRPPDPWGSELLKDVGPIQPDSDAGLKTLARLLRPGLLVFVLSEHQNRPQYPRP